jgi:hypothetical protein
MYSPLQCFVERLSGSVNQTVLVGDEARDLLRLGHAWALENNERRGSGRMGQHAAKMAGAGIHFAAGDAGSEGDMAVRDKQVSCAGNF